ncbi:MAG: hypothetical protein HWN81_05850 [Candidatus Lokiarchaeota archaeon]|nr:hypothetical protein [Candidatus Lokiarchaeota archaeon]
MNKIETAKKSTTKKTTKRATKKVAKVKKKETKAKKLFGPDLYKRDKHGLLESVDYQFNEDGSIDWRSMIKPEFLYPNKGWFDARNKPVPDSIDGLKDNQLLIMLGGIKDLARLRGFHSVSYQTHTELDYVTAKCQITWMGNYETPSDHIHFEDVANATADNTDNFCVKFLETIACNRAFVRCVRNFLNIHIVGADEIDKSDGSTSSAASSRPANLAPITPSRLLEKTLSDKHNVDSFDAFKELLRDLWKSEKYINESVKDWNNFGDIPAKEARKLISIISK